MHIVSLEHFRADGPGKILGWAERRGHELHRVFLDEGHGFPALDACEFLLVMGGPMNIYQHRDHPWLVPEKAFIRAAADSGIPVLGICLGAQLLADVLGGKVYQNAEREIGWWPIRVRARTGPFSSFPEEFTVCHWHGDTFELPPGAVHIAESDACARQAFLVGDRLTGLQFHLELGQIHVSDLADGCANDLTPGRYVQSRDQLLRAPPNPAVLDSALESLLDALVACGSSEH